MARQGNGLKLEGTIGDLCFYKSRYGYLVRMKSSITKRRIKTDPAFAYTRRNNTDFGTAARAVGILRSAFGGLLRRASDPDVTSRLMSVMLKAIRADAVNPHGCRTVKDGQPQLLERFEFNQYTSLYNIFRAPFTGSIDRSREQVTINIPAFLVGPMISIPQGATHFRLSAASAAIDFEREETSLAIKDSDLFPTSRKKVGPLRLVQKIKPLYPDHPGLQPGQIFVLFGIEFLKIVDAQHTPVNNGQSNALAIIKVRQ